MWGGFNSVSPVAFQCGAVSTKFFQWCYSVHWVNQWHCSGIPVYTGPTSVHWLRVRVVSWQIECAPQNTTLWYPSDHNLWLCWISTLFWFLFEFFCVILISVWVFCHSTWYTLFDTWCFRTILCHYAAHYTYQPTFSHGKPLGIFTRVAIN